MNRQPIALLQSEVQAWAEAYWDGEYWPVHANLARLTEEVGEVARAVNQGFGPKRVKTGETRAALAGELADTLFVLLCLANSAEIDLQSAFEAVLAKYRDRDESG